VLPTGARTDKRSSRGATREGAPRVVQTADDQLAREPRREQFVCLAEPASARSITSTASKQRRVRLCDLERDLGPLARIGGQLQRLFQVHAGNLATGVRLC
jgi:hypothetical protein